jgi:predicted Na+-dependent transporter
MSNIVIGLFFAVGLGGFVYSKMMHQTGGNTKNSVIVTLIAAVIGFFVIYTLFGFFLSDN